MREQNAFMKRTAIIVAILSVIIFFGASLTSYAYVEKNSATAEEMSTQANTLMEIYQKLKPEEIDLLSGNDDYLTHNVSNKLFGKIYIFGDPNGNYGVSCDYQKGEKIIVTLIFSFIVTFISHLFLKAIGQQLLIRRLKRNDFAP